MAFALREYQNRGIKMLYQSIRDGNKRVVWVWPTGAGKSTVCSRFVKSCVNNNKNVLFAVHSKELVQQFSDRLKDQFGIGSGIIMAGVKPNPRNPVQVASIMSLIRRNPPPADVVIIDECHRSNANSYQKMVDNYPNAIFIGLTATPFRGDGKGLSKTFDTIVHPVTIKELISLGHLVGTKVFCPESAVNLAGIATKMGDFDKVEMFGRFNDVTAYRSVVENYRKHAEGMKAIAFNINIEHSMSQHDEFLRQGIKSAHLDGTTDKNERSDVVQAFSEGHLKILNNVGLFTEGFDVPDTESVILNRGTKSFGLYVQMVGRGLRPAPGKAECVVLDHGGNTLRHGFVEDYDLFPFSLDGLPKKKKNDDTEAPTKECELCHKVVKTQVKICSCGFVFPVKEVELTMSDGEKMVMLDRDAVVLERLQGLRYQSAEKLPLHLLRIYATLRGFEYGWALHRAIDGDLIQTRKNPDGSRAKDPDEYKRAKFLIDTEEKRHGTDILIKKLKKQLDGRTAEIDFQTA